MAFSFCIGPSGSGRSSLLRRRMIRQASASLRNFGKSAEKYLFIVPEQYTMQTQQELVRDHPDHVLMNIDVLSFGRLAYRVFEETGTDTRRVLDDTGKSLLLRRAAARCEKDLRILGRGIRRAGMIDEVKSVLSEFMQYGISEEEIGQMAGYAAEHGQNALEARLNDIRLLYTAFRQEEKDRYVTSEETLELLAEAIPKAESLRGSVIVFDGFTGFTTVQYRVIARLIRCAADVVFSLAASCDQGPDLTLTAAGGPAGSEENLFFLTRRTVRDILKMAQKEGLERGEDIFLTDMEELPRFRENRVLRHLERSLFRFPEIPFTEEKQEETASCLRLFTASSPRDEVKEVFSRIHSEIARSGCAYRDFAVVTADLETYGDLFAAEAARSDIPLYVDRTSGAFHNILIEGIRGILQISLESFSYASVFRYLRSGLSCLLPEEVDLLENYCLSHGIRGRKKWAAPFDASCEAARLRFLKEAAPVTGDILDPVPARRSARTAAERTRELYAFLVGCGAQERTQSLADGFSEQGDVVREMQYRQVYRSVIDLLDQVYSLAGEEKMSARDYLELLEAGFSQIRLGTLPQQVDRVLVGDMERTRLTQVKHLFFVGANDGNIPRGASRGGLLSDMDREFLASGGAVLAPTPREQMFTQRFYLYLNMTKSTHSLTVSCASVSMKGKALRPSYLISMISRLFPALRMEYPEQQPAQERITDRVGGLTLLAGLLRRYAEGEYPEHTEILFDGVKVDGEKSDREGNCPEHTEILFDREKVDGEKSDREGNCLEHTEILFDREKVDGEKSDREGNCPEHTEITVRGACDEFSVIYGFYTSREVMSDPQTRRAVELLRRAAFFRYRPEALRAQIARGLYGKLISGGVSRIECGARCMLEHHLRYGLRLRERDVYEFQAVDEGTILHLALQYFDAALRETGTAWRDFSREEAERLCRKALSSAAALYRNLLLYKSFRDESRLERLERRLLRTVDTLQYQIQRGDFIPAASELQFGDTGTSAGEGGAQEIRMPEIRFDLGKGRILVLAGRIDRVDLYMEEGRRYIRIMDYKTGKRDLDKDFIRRGLQLQLITYMEAIRNAEPAFLQRLLSESGGQSGSTPPDSASEAVPSAMLYYRIAEPVIDVSPEEIPDLIGKRKTGEKESIRSRKTAGRSEASDTSVNTESSSAPGVDSVEAERTEIIPIPEKDPRLVEIRKKLRPTGLVYEENESISHLDRCFEKSSDVIPLVRTKDGFSRSLSKTVTPEEYPSLAKAAADAICLLANRILDGDISASPSVIDKKGTAACSFCPFREACGFDLRIPGYTIASEERSGGSMQQADKADKTE